MANSPKLHELIAVEPTVRQRAEAEVNRLISLFTGGLVKLVGQKRVYHPYDEEKGEKMPSEESALATTVDKELADFEKVYGDYIAVAVRKEQTNSSGHAHADVIVNGEIFLADMSATALLNLEGKLSELHKVYDRLPVLDDTVEWTRDENMDCWRAPVRTTYKTAKTPHVNVLYPATPEHPAQTESYYTDDQVGEWSTHITSGALQRREKRDMIERLDIVIAAVKAARQRANNVDAVPHTNVAETIFNFINGNE